MKSFNAAAGGTEGSREVGRKGLKHENDYWEVDDPDEEEAEKFGCVACVVRVTTCER